jgi:hypothetical protein
VVQTLGKLRMLQCTYLRFMQVGCFRDCDTGTVPPRREGLLSKLLRKSDGLKKTCK